MTDEVRQSEQVSGERWRYTIDDFRKLREVGIFKGSDRVELLDGDFYGMGYVGLRDSGHVRRLIRILSRELREHGLIDAQNPVRLGPQSHAQPDVVVLGPSDDDYVVAYPTAADVLLLIEVSEYSLVHDRETKAPAYAQAGIADYWIVDLVHSEVLVYREPVEGVYRSIVALGKEDSIQPLAFPDATVAVSEILA